MKYPGALTQTEEGYSVCCPGLPGCWSQGIATLGSSPWRQVRGVRSRQRGGAAPAMATATTVFGRLRGADSGLIGSLGKRDG